MKESESFSFSGFILYRIHEWEKYDLQSTGTVNSEEKMSEDGICTSKQHEKIVDDHASIAREEKLLFKNRFKPAEKFTSNKDPLSSAHARK